MTNLSPYERIRSIAIDEIKLDMEIDGRKNVTPGEIESHVSNLLKLKPQFKKVISKESLINDLKTSFSIKVLHKQVILSSDDKSDWYSSERKKKDREVGFWARYEDFIRKKIPGIYRQQLDDCTNEVMSNLEDPNSMGEWDKRGLVMGSVQSGKTSQIVGVVNKALDSGYQFIVILCGMTNDLRSQTQDRIDEGVLGKETFNEFGISEMTKGVGFEGQVIFQPETFTNSSSKGDFSKQIAKQVTLDPTGKSPRILVIKKQKSILDTLIKKFETFNEERGSNSIDHFQLLVIDDECDQASVDTKKSDNVLSTINESIRKLLKLFKRKAYIGYTATPYANAAINHLAFHEQAGVDLYPKDFIFQLPMNTDYVGLNRLFPEIRIDEYDNEIEDSSYNSALEPIYDYIDDFENNQKRIYEKNADIKGWMPPAHRIDHIPKFGGKKEIPDSLKEAIIYFTLASCVKTLRNKESLKHNSMMIHATKFNNVQSLIVQQVDNFLNILQSTQYEWLQEVESQILKVWDEKFNTLLNNNYNPEQREIEWYEIKNIYGEQVSKIRVQEINNKTKDNLDYREFKEQGKNVIAIGGNRLSRGLTLEGLNVSYYLRSAKTSAVATATQMGRWFGYRNSYDDVCKIYMPESTIYLFQKLYETERHFRAEIRRMNAIGATPKDFGLRFLSYDGVKLDSPSKMRHCISYSQNIDQQGKIKQITSVLPHKNHHNIKQTEKFLNQLGYPKYIGSGLSGLSSGKTIPYDKNLAEKKLLETGSYIWTDVEGSKISDFILTQNFITPTYEMFTNNGDYISEYINLMMEYGELKNWTIVLRNKTSGKLKSSIAGYPLYLSKRAARNVAASEKKSLNKWNGDLKDFDQSKQDKYIIGVTNDPGLEKFDLNESEIKDMKKYEKAIIDSSDKENEIYYKIGQCARMARSPKKGLLILYPFYPTEEKENKNNEVKEPYLLWVISFPFRKIVPSHLKLNRKITLNTVEIEQLEKQKAALAAKWSKNHDDNLRNWENATVGYVSDEEEDYRDMLNDN